MIPKEFWEEQAKLREVQRRGAPAMGAEVERDGRRYVCVRITTDGRVGFAAIPDGMTVMDLGRKFEGRVDLWEQV